MTATATQQPKPRRDWYQDLKIEDCKPKRLPVDDTSDLPPGEMIVRKFKNKEGRTGAHTVLLRGEPRFYLEWSASKEWVSLIGVCKKGSNTERRNIRTIKPRDPNALQGAHPNVLAQAQKDRAILKHLRELGIPEVYAKRAN